MRVTQSMMARQYTKRVSGALNDLSYVNKQVGSGRKFFKGSENPAGAAKAYQLRRQASQADDYVSNLEEAQSTIQTKESAMTQVSKALEDVYTSLLGVMNGTKNTKDDKAIVAQQFRSVQETVVKDMNTKYGDKFLFGGSNVSEVPFILNGNSLTYRGVDVSGNTQYTWPDGTDKAGQREDSKVLLKQLSEDALYTDLGFGLEFKDGQVVSSSAYNTATAGINVLGYGTAENGLSNNVVVLIGQMATMLDNDCEPSKLDDYLTKFKELKQNVLNATTATGSDSMFLDYTQSRLEDLQDNLAEKTSNTEYIDSEEAIMNLNSVDYMYQALLKTGQNILSKSFIDFMS
ncbi:flagellin N-terminal helical domain-containing protein [Aminipila terrae]|uniref:Flagellin N-terminal domain-containing protein n=1 Tax=Aminipila terrae TaxID=2697030 RepID=A0A6P1MDF0_9FIRM|nr:hypothetical protein [Aminipila terrae]QHI71937.1 hypothetical protein Ami3637_05625 [Aminipila terrae]